MDIQTVKQQVVSNARPIGDGAAYASILATFAGYLPAIAAGLSAIWIAMQIVEKMTGKAIHVMIRCAWHRVTSAFVRRATKQ